MIRLKAPFRAGDRVAAGQRGYGVVKQGLVENRTGRLMFYVGIETGYGDVLFYESSIRKV